MKYRLFAQDIGKDGYSGLRDIGCPGSQGDSDALRIAYEESQQRGARVLPLRHTRKDMWPDGETGLLPKGVI